MLSSKSMLTILVVAGLVGLLTSCAYAQYIYTDYGPGNDIYRYNLDGTPAGLTAGSALFADLPATAVNQVHDLAYNATDGYIYMTSHYDGEWANATNQWGPGANYVTRVNATTGVMDANWKVGIGDYQNWNKAADTTIAPDGRLYVTDKQVGSVYLINIATQTSTMVVPGANLANYIAFDDAGNAYVATSSAGVRRYAVSGTTWTRDMSYAGDGAADIPTGYEWGLAYGPDDMLYVNDYYGHIYRLNSAGVLDETAPGEAWTVGNGLVSSVNMDFGPDGRLYVRAVQGLDSVNVAGTPIWQNVMTGYGWGVTFSNAVPEPGSLLALCAGLGSMAAFLRRRK